MKKILFLLWSLFVIAWISYAINIINEWWKVSKNTGSATIDAHSLCKIVTNNRTDYDVFVPTKTTDEWSAFRSHLPSNVSLSECGCYSDSDCSGWEVCVGVSWVCTWTATDPCDTVKTVWSIIGTPIKVTSCSFQSYYVDLNVLYNTSEIIMLDGVNSSSNYANSACSAYLSDTCKDLYYPGSALQGIYVESWTPDKRVTTSTCGSNKNIVSWKANTLALKNIRCYGWASSTSTCNTVSSLSECATIAWCYPSVPWNCVEQTCWTANGGSFTTLTSTSSNLCNAWSATNFVANTSTWTRNCWTASCSANKQSVCGNGIVEGSEVCDGNSTSCTIGGVGWTKYCNSTCNWRLGCSVYPCIVWETWDPNTCAWCKGSWTMSSCINRSCSAHGVDDAVWTCTYNGDSENCRSWQGYCDDDTCFVWGTKVKTADGTQKNIEDIQIWEKIIGQDNQINTVIAYDRPNLGNRKLYSINNGPYFVTHEHPFMTTQWWKSINPEATRREMPNFEILPLKVGDILVRENWEFEYIWSIQSTIADPNTLLYNFKLNGNNTYYANGYLVHNKTYCGDGSSCPTGYECVGSYCAPEAGWCFIEKTKITLWDGTLTNIENIKIGDIVLWSENTKNKVIQLYKLPNTHWKIYSINNSDYFVTDTHPFMTIDWWKSFNPLGTLKENPDMIVSKLEIGDVLITEKGIITLQNFDYKEWSWYVYNFKLDWNNTYYADWYLVHNPGVK